MMADMRVIHQNLESDFNRSYVNINTSWGYSLGAVALDFKHEINVKQAENTI